MNKLYKTPIITSIVMLFLALFNLPEGYYTLLRIIVCGAAVYFVFIAEVIKKLSWVWIMGFIAILFNPFITIHLDKEVWSIIDIIVGVVFFIGIFILSNDGSAKFLSKFRVFIKNPYKKAFIILIIILLSVFIISMIPSHGIKDTKIRSGKLKISDRYQPLREYRISPRYLQGGRSRSSGRR